MANDCCGVLKVVSKNRETLLKVRDILEYSDDDYCLYRCRYSQPMDKEPFKDGDYWVWDFDVSGAWSCNPFFTYATEGNNDKLIEGYEKDENGRENYDKPIYGTATFTNLCNLAPILDFGCELYCSEPGMGFCQHFTVTHNGEYHEEDGDYTLDYPEGEDGEPDYDQEPTEEFGIDGFMNFSFADEIYGE